ncbi:MAG: Succinyl-CoA ligase [ADP-forming] alpha chain [Firmicutes bacterium]|nr:Succinyl-CoA ligase [ADP-forming] alpha chain [Bacillota bacterium]
MSIYLRKDMRIAVLGITGTVGMIQTKLALDYGSNIVAGVSPGKGGQQVHGIPVFDNIVEAINKQGVNAAVLYVPAAKAPDAAHEVIDSGIELVVIITEHIPTKENILIKLHAREKGTIVIGPNCAGILTPGIGKLGIIPANVATPGRVGVVSRSGSLSFEITYELSNVGIGQSTIVGIGGDSEPCTSFTDVLSSFENDADTDAVVLIGEVGGSSEEKAAQYIKKCMKKPVFAYIAGRSAPPGKKMGHAGAIVRGTYGTVRSKVEALEAAGAYVANSPMDISKMILDKFR